MDTEFLTDPEDYRGCPILDDSRSTGSPAERQLLRKLPFRIEISEAIADPKRTIIKFIRNTLIVE